MKKRSALLKFLKLVLLLSLVMILSIVGTGAIYAFQQNSYEDTYYAELSRKVERLEQVPGKRVVIIGGSSVAFGIDSKLVEQELGMPCVNFGLYAAFGLKPMLDLSLERLHRGDIVIIAPETTSQMYSGYCGYEYLLQAFESRIDLLAGFGTEYYPGLAAKVPGYIRDAKQLRKMGGASGEGVYSLTAFDEYGDIVYPRPENVMEKGYLEDNLPELRKEVVTGEFLDMINDYAFAARLKGAKVYFSFCPINTLALGEADEAEQEVFVRALRDGLDCPILSPLSDHVMDAGFFYDSNYHLNDIGARYNTLLLIADLQRVQGSMSRTVATLPHPPVLQRNDEVLSSGVQDGIAYDVTARGAIVTGLDEQGKAMQMLSIPETLAEADVISVTAAAFEGSAAEELVLPATITQLPGRLFAGMDKLARVTILSDALPEVGDELLLEANPGIRICVPSDLYGSYITDYFWGAYAGQTEALQ